MRRTNGSDKAKRKVHEPLCFNFSSPRWKIQKIGASYKLWARLCAAQNDPLYAACVSLWVLWRKEKWIPCDGMRWTDSIDHRRSTEKRIDHHERSTRTRTSSRKARDESRALSSTTVCSHFHCSYFHCSPQVDRTQREKEVNIAALNISLCPALLATNLSGYGGWTTFPSWSALRFLSIPRPTIFSIFYKLK